MSEKYELPVNLNDPDLAEKPIDGLYTYQEGMVLGGSFVLGFAVSFIVPFSIIGFIFKVIIVVGFLVGGFKLIKASHERYDMPYLDYIRFKLDYWSSAKTEFSYRESIFRKKR